IAQSSTISGTSSVGRPTAQQDRGQADLNRTPAAPIRMTMPIVRWPAGKPIYEGDTMRRSTERILTTHTGSLPRPPELLEILEGRDQREARAQPNYDQRVKAAVIAAVQQQADAGIDVLTDGEMGRVAFSWYATERLTGFDGA